VRNNALGRETSKTIMTSVSELTHSKETDSGRSSENQNGPGLKPNKVAVLVFKVFLYVLPFLLAGDITAAVSFSKSVEHGSRQELNSLKDLVAAIKAQGNLVRVEDIEIDSLFPEMCTRKMIRIGSECVEVFIFNNKETARKAAICVDPRGFSSSYQYSKGPIRSSGVFFSWIDKPHFYKNGRLIAVYIGHDSAMEKLLTTIMGLQFAGQ
jgi:hypothetical protein